MKGERAIRRCICYVKGIFFTLHVSKSLRLTLSTLCCWPVDQPNLTFWPAIYMSGKLKAWFWLKLWKRFTRLHTEFIVTECQFRSKPSHINSVPIWMNGAGAVAVILHDDLQLHSLVTVASNPAHKVSVLIRLQTNWDYDRSCLSLPFVAAQLLLTSSYIIVWLCNITDIPRSCHTSPWSTQSHCEILHCNQTWFCHLHGKDFFSELIFWINTESIPGCAQISLSLMGDVHGTPIVSR